MGRLTSLPEGARIRLRPGITVRSIQRRFINPDCANALFGVRSGRRDELCRRFSLSRLGANQRAAQALITALRQYGAIVVDRSEVPTLYAQFNVDWTRENVSTRGPFGAHYRVWGDGKQMVPGDKYDYFGVSGLSTDSLRKLGYVVWLPPRPKGEFLGEGDTFTFINLVGNGLEAYRDETRALSI